MDEVLRELRAVGPFFTVAYGKEPPGAASGRSASCTGRARGLRRRGRAADRERVRPGGGFDRAVRDRVAALVARARLRRPVRAGAGPAPRRPVVAAARSGVAGAVAARARRTPRGNPGAGPRGQRARPPRGARHGAARAVRRLAAGAARQRRLRAGRRRPGAHGPGAGEAAALLAAGLLADGGPLEGTGTYLHEPGLGVAFLRRSCCLYYKVPGGGLCGDCVLRTK